MPKKKNTPVEQPKALKTFKQEKLSRSFNELNPVQAMAFKEEFELRRFNMFDRPFATKGIVLDRTEAQFAFEALAEFLSPKTAKASD